MMENEGGSGILYIHKLVTWRTELCIGQQGSRRKMQDTAEGITALVPDNRSCGRFIGRIVLMLEFCILPSKRIRRVEGLTVNT